MARYDAIPDDHDVARWVKPKLLVANDDGEICRDANGNPAEVFASAFVLRDSEDYLSVTSVNFFGTVRMENIREAAEAFRQSQLSKRLPNLGAFVIGNVGQTKITCNSHKHKVRIVEEPVDGNPCHVAVLRFPDGLSELHEQLACDVFSERYFYETLR